MFERLKRRLAVPTMATRIGWIMVAVLAVLALLPWAHAALTVGILLVGLALLVFVYWTTTASQLSKTVRVPVKHIPSDSRDRYKKGLETALGALGDVREVKERDKELVAVVRTRHDLAALRRHIKRQLKGLKLFPAAVEARVEYSALAASGEAVVEVSGQVPPHALVEIPGLKEPVSADASGEFHATIPWTVAAKVASHGTISATYRHQGKKHSIEIAL